MDSRLPRLTAVVVLVAAAALVARPGAGPDDSSQPPTTATASHRNAPAAASEAPLRGEPMTVGDRLLVQASIQLERRRSVTARVSHRINLEGKQFTGRGSYWQQGNGEDLRVRLELNVAEQDANLLQVANSPFLWLDRRLPTGRTVVRVDLRKLRADPVLAAASFDEIQPGGAIWASANSGPAGRSGGLPRLLAALGECFSFLPPQAMRLVPPGQSQSSGVPYFAVVGHWRQEKLTALLERQELSAAVPDRLPQEVLLLFGQTDLFPYRIEYRGMETPRSSLTSATSVPYQLSMKPTVVVELSDVAFDVPIAAGQFDYMPRDVDWVDRTAAVLERLRRQREEKVAVRGAGLSGASTR